MSKISDREIDRLVKDMDDSLDEFIRLYNDGEINQFHIVFTTDDDDKHDEIVSYTGKGEDADD